MLGDTPRSGTPFAQWADAMFLQLESGDTLPTIAALSGETLLAERALLNGHVVAGLRSAGGCRLMRASDGWLALNLSRPEDRALLPALFEDDAFDASDDSAIVTATARGCAETMVQVGRELGLAISRDGEHPAAPAVTWLTAHEASKTRRDRPPLVVDLSALWAGPLASHLLWLAGAQVVKVESLRRTDAMRQGDPALFARLNQGKDSVLVDFTEPEGRNALLSLLRRADIVIEAARPRALEQLGISAEVMVREQPGMLWIHVTAHGATGPSANWVGFGDDCGVAGGLSGALREAGAGMGFVGDAIADPMSGIVAATEAWRSWRSGQGGRLAIAMSGVVAEAVAWQRAVGAGAFAAELANWAARVGQPYPCAAMRCMTDRVHALGADTRRWLGHATC